MVTHILLAVQHGQLFLQLIAVNDFLLVPRTTSPVTHITNRLIRIDSKSKQRASATAHMCFIIPYNNVCTTPFISTIWAQPKR